MLALAPTHKCMQLAACWLVTCCTYIYIAQEPQIEMGSHGRHGCIIPGGVSPLFQEDDPDECVQV